MKNSMPKNIADWSIDQLQKPEILQSMLLKSQEEKEYIVERCKSLVEVLNNAGLHKPTPKPLNSIVALPRAYLSRTKTIRTFQKSSLFGTKTVELIQFNRKYHRVVVKKSGLFKTECRRAFVYLDQALKYFDEVAK